MFLCTNVCFIAKWKMFFLIKRMKQVEILLLSFLWQSGSPFLYLSLHIWWLLKLCKTVKHYLLSLVNSRIQAANLLICQLFCVIKVVTGYILDFSLLKRIFWLIHFNLQLETASHNNDNSTVQVLRNVIWCNYRSQNYL